MRLLAIRYLNEEADEAGSRLLNQSIATLSPEEMRQFNAELVVLGRANNYEAEVANTLTEMSIDRGVGIFELGEDDLRLAIERVNQSRSLNSNNQTVAIQTLSLCPPAHEYCTLWRQSSTTSLYGFNGIQYGTTASWSDRQSTEACEFLGCDHRFRFAGTRRLIDGKTTAYDNWIASYPSILGSQTGNETYAIMGNGHAILKRIFWVDASLLQAY